MSTTGTVAFDEGNDGFVGYGEGAVVLHRDLVGHVNHITGTPEADDKRRFLLISLPVAGRGRDNRRVNGSGGRPAKLLGRERELAIARTALGTSRSHGVLLVGEAGVGKTSLARAALDEVATRPGHETLWLVASAVEPSIPFGAFAPFVPEIGGKPGRQPDAFFLLQAVRRAIVEYAGGRRLFIGVDDAHSLDSQSATLLFQLVAAEGAKVVVARRAGAEVPGGVRSLWKEGLVERIDLEPLGRDATLEYAADLLRDPVGSVRYVGARSHAVQLGGDLAEALWRVSGGNPLYLRELIHAGLQTGRVRSDRDVWHLNGELTVGPRLTELLQDRLGRLSAEETNVLELVSFADPIPLTVLRRLADPDLISSLQRQSLLRVERSDSDNLVRAGHPLYAESVRESIPAARAAELSRQLADAFEVAGRMEANLLRVVSWQLDAGHQPGADLLITGSLRAAERQDWNLSRRLAKEAVAGGGGPEATFALADALRALGRYRDALEVLGDRDGEGDDELARVAVLRALILFWGLGRVDDADEVLARAENRIVSEGDRTWVEAVRAGMFNFAGRPLDAVAKARPLLARAGLAPRTEMTVRSALAMGLAWSGRALEAVAVADVPLMHGVQEVPGPASIRWSLVARAVAYRLAGRLSDLENLARSQYESALLLNNRHTRGSAACALGWVALPRGQLTSAVGFFREAAAALGTVRSAGEPGAGAHRPHRGPGGRRRPGRGGRGPGRSPAGHPGPGLAPPPFHRLGRLGHRGARRGQPGPGRAGGGGSPGPGQRPGRLRAAGAQRGGPARVDRHRGPGDGAGRVGRRPVGGSGGASRMCPGRRLRRGPRPGGREVRVLEPQPVRGRSRGPGQSGPRFGGPEPAGLGLVGPGPRLSRRRRAPAVRDGRRPGPAGAHPPGAGGRDAGGRRSFQSGHRHPVVRLGADG